MPCIQGGNRSLLDTKEQLYFAGKPRQDESQHPAAHINGCAYVSAHNALWDTGNKHRGLIPSPLIVFLTFREAGKIIGEDFMYIVRPLLPSIAGSGVMIVATGVTEHIGCFLSEAEAGCFSCAGSGGVYGISVVDEKGVVL